MTYRITQTTDGQHLGEVFDAVEAGQVLTFPDGDVVPVEKVFRNSDGSEVVAISTNYQITFSKE